MKARIVVFLLLFQVVLNVNTARAELKPSFTITRQDSSSIYVVDYVGSKIGNVILTIMNIDKTTIVTKYINGSKDFSLPINFSSMPEGTYTIEVDNGSEKVFRELNYSSSTQPTYSHILSLGENRYLFTSSHVGNEKIIIRIFDGTGSEVYSEEKVVDGNLALLFNLKNISGRPTFEVSDGSGRSLMVPANPTFVVVKKSNHL